MVIKVVRKPLVTTIALIFIVGTIYFMTSNDVNLEKSLGQSSPINLIKNNMPKLNNFGEYPGDSVSSNNQEQIINQKEESISDLTNEYGDAKDEEKVDRFEEDAEENVVPKPSAKTKSTIKKTAAATAAVVKSDVEPQAGLAVGGGNGNEITEVPFMPKMANETLKAQLGNAAWKLFHTILARYPDTPSPAERTTLSQYIQLFGQVYPCGDCARHFQKLLKKYPPQTKSRKTAALWGCDIHNKVNEKLGKSIYDCTTILEDYDCGCGADELEPDFTLGGESIDHLKKIKIDEVEKDGQLGG